MNDTKDYSDRIEELKNELSTANALKSVKEKELEKLKQEMQTLKTKCIEEFECEPKNLKQKIQLLEKDISDKLEEAEQLLEKLSEEE